MSIQESLANDYLACYRTFVLHGDKISLIGTEQDIPPSTARLTLLGVQDVLNTSTTLDPSNKEWISRIVQYILAKQKTHKLSTFGSLGRLADGQMFVASKVKMVGADLSRDEETGISNVSIWLNTQRESSMSTLTYSVPKGNVASSIEEIRSFIDRRHSTTRYGAKVFKLPGGALLDLDKVMYVSAAKQYLPTQQRFVLLRDSGYMETLDDMAVGDCYACLTRKLIRYHSGLYPWQADHVNSASESLITLEWAVGEGKGKL